MRIPTSLFTISIFLFSYAVFPTAYHSFSFFFFYMIPKQSIINKFIMTHLSGAQERGDFFSTQFKFCSEIKWHSLWLTKCKMKNSPLRCAVHINYSGGTKVDRDGRGCQPSQWKRTPAKLCLHWNKAVCSSLYSNVITNKS